MFNKLKSLRKNIKTHREHGNTIALYIIIFPIIFGSFGIAADSAIAAYTYSTLQSGLDAATQSGLSRAKNPDVNAGGATTPRLTADEAKDYITTYYNTNRLSVTDGVKKNPFLKCQTQPYTPAGRLSTGTCPWTIERFSVTSTGTIISVNTSFIEQSHTMFLHILNKPTVEYRIESAARVTYTQG